MFKRVQQYVAECNTCQTHKYSTLSPAGLIQPLPISEKIWDEISMDFIDGLPTSQGKNVILVFVDRLSKYSHFTTIKNLFQASIVERVLIYGVIKLHGCPSSII